MDNPIKINVPQAKKYAYQLNTAHHLLYFDGSLSSTTGYSDTTSVEEMKQVVNNLANAITDLKGAVHNESISLTSATETFETLDQTLNKMLGIQETGNPLADGLLDPSVKKAKPLSENPFKDKLN